MTGRAYLFRTIHLLVLGLLLVGALPGTIVTAGSSSPSDQPSQIQLPESSSEETTQYIYLPLAMENFPWVSPFGVESNSSVKKGKIYLPLAEELKTSWIRLGNNRVSWRELQPVEGGPIQWEQLAGFELELKNILNAKMTPIVVINDSPSWATDNSVRNDGLPTSCGPILPEKLPAYAEFLRQLVERYKSAEFNVHHWEIGNEPDVDPDLVGPNYGFGCWGDIDDLEFYGGERYGEMLKAVGPVIKAEDPFAKIWIGGLLLDSPNTTAEGKGKPERFLRGVLESGAAPYFDIVAYHSYPPYLDQVMDYDLEIGLWSEMGGSVVGKARFLRQIMAEYGVDKPVFLNETSLMCPEVASGVPTSWCNPPSSVFYQMQANYAVRSLVRGFSENISGFIWYTLDGPGWRNTGLLDENKEPKPVYHAYQQLNLQLLNTRYLNSESLGEGIEAYAFRRAKEIVHVAWAIEDTALTLSFPKSKFIAAYDRDGNEITPTEVGSNFQIPVGFSPVYVITNY